MRVRTLLAGRIGALIHRLFLAGQNARRGLLAGVLAIGFSFAAVSADPYDTLSIYCGYYHSQETDGARLMIQDGFSVRALVSLSAETDSLASGLIALAVTALSRKDYRLFERAELAKLQRELTLSVDTISTTKDLQSALSRLRSPRGVFYCHGPSTGELDGRVVRAVIRGYQEDHGLQVDGIAGPRTKESLIADLRDRPGYWVGLVGLPRSVTRAGWVVCLSIAGTSEQVCLSGYIFGGGNAAVPLQRVYGPLRALPDLVPKLFADVPDRPRAGRVLRAVDPITGDRCATDLALQCVRAATRSVEAVVGNNRVGVSVRGPGLQMGAELDLLATGRPPGPYLQILLPGHPTTHFGAAVRLFARWEMTRPRGFDWGVSFDRDFGLARVLTLRPFVEVAPEVRIGCALVFRIRD